MLIYVVVRRASEALIIMPMLSLPLALVGRLWLIWALAHAVSIASVIGFLALAGVAAEFGIIMLLSTCATRGSAASNASQTRGPTSWTTRSAKAPCCACGPRP